MALQPGANYPGGSKERVRRAGDAVRAGTPTDEDLAVIDLWRSSHRPVLNTFQSILRNRTRGKKILVAQRHKRRATIFDKLTRFPKMQLSRMDDIAGCRLIFESVQDLTAFRHDFHKANFNHRRRNADDKYNYILHPNPETGYRGIHDVYEYDVRSQYADMYRGLLIEIQYRTRIQHAWATCVELIGFITENQPKFKKGDKRFQHILLLSSEILARCFESSKSSLPDIADADLIKEFVALDNEIGFINLLRGLNATSAEVSKNKNMILIFSTDGSLDVHSYRDAPDALRALFKLEQESSGKDIVLVRADTADEVRVAFKNYFSDAHEFLELIDRGCEKLAGIKFGITRGPRRPKVPFRGAR
ncbi:RelA/SpoT domain-containing protein [Bosea lathyri]|uniref:PpGpp synthetase catalytic domain-containing protein (RelA/SpoT-type nucleotidyltranferase) n=1 Tax=Bosea lathyri TaxID=1036778 RepID=A0A1H6BFJ1_9HYPH|nr:RelA/SpoT domain-containing protein [Bosea lathyri]SEG59374.1 ppGpp synthetase catalytic domain-containing protein (RelA/SpoT-type nucleotidyltranferase) [Bosea lathyri]